MMDRINPAAARETILLVEDEQAVRALAVRVLRRRGFQVIEAADGKDALRLAEQASQPIDLLVTDLIMPGVDGPALATRLLPSRPTMRVLFMSGYMEQDVRERSDITHADFLGKPFLPEDLIGKVEAILAVPHAVASESAA